MRLLTPQEIERLPPEARAEYLKLQAELASVLEANPLERFHSCATYCGLPGCFPPDEGNPTGGHPKQNEFMAAQTKIQAAFAGNRFGKTTALVCKAFIQHVPDDQLPARLKPFKVVKHDNPVFGRILCPSDDAMQDYLIPKMQEWVPRHLLAGGEWSKAWSKQHSVLHFKDGGQLKIFTYKQDASTLIGAACDYVGYDEPPPQEHRNENLARLTDKNGFEMYAMTPVNMKGGGIGWIYRELFKKRHEPYITVVQGQIHDNPTMDPQSVAFTLSQYPEEERRAREKGEFLHLGGVVYAGGFEHNLCKPASPEHVKDWDVVVGIDPGLKNAAFVWVGFDSDNVAYVFDEVLLQEKTPADYANAIHRTNQKWGAHSPTYIIDPSARNRSLVNAENVESLLAQRGIYCVHGQNQVEPGVQQVRLRLQRKAAYIAENCRGLRDEAEEYRMQDRPDGEFKVVKENDHRLDALRYVLMYRLYDPLLERQGPPGDFVFDGTTAPNLEEIDAMVGSLSPPSSPLGSMS